jgi:hypothetical protein
MKKRAQFTTKAGIHHIVSLERKPSKKSKKRGHGQKKRMNKKLLKKYRKLR